MVLGTPFLPQAAQKRIAAVKAKALYDFKTEIKNYGTFSKLKVRVSDELENVIDTERKAEIQAAVEKAQATAQASASSSASAPSFIARMLG